MSNPALKQEVAVTRPIPQEAFDWYDEYAHGVMIVAPLCLAWLDWLHWAIV